MAHGEFGDFFLTRADAPWMFDATRMGLGADAVDGLDWDTAFDAMTRLEAGEIANPDEGRRVGHFWLRAPETAPDVDIAHAITDAAQQVRSFADAIHRGDLTPQGGGTFTDVLHIGIGGSQLGPALLLDALGEDAEGVRSGLTIHFFDNTDPDGIHRTLRRLGDRLATSLVLVISKSGGTPEPMNGLALTLRALADAGIDAPKHLVALTMAGSKLHTRATEEGWLKILPLWDWVGGRYSVTSPVGLLPAALAGLDTEALLSGARDMDTWTRTPRWRDNPAALMAAAWHLAGNGHGDRAMVMLPYADRLVLLSRYLQQLVMESIGKSHNTAGELVRQGLTVYGNKGSTDQHAYVQQLRDGRDDFFAVFVQVLAPHPYDPVLADDVTAGDHLQGFLVGTRRALTTNDRASITLTVPTVDAYVLGGLIALFERAVGLYAHLVGINAYHQPGVEAGKKAAREVLALSRGLRQQLAASGPATLSELCRAMDSDPVETLYILQRLALTGRVQLDGDPLDGTFAIQ